MRVLAVLLAVAAIGSLVVSLASHRQEAVGWTMYTPLTNDLPAVHRGARVYEYPDAAGASMYSEYDGMPWDDARLWLGLAIGFGVSAAAVGVAAWRRQSRPTSALMG